MTYVDIDSSRPNVRVVTLNRPERRNALGTELVSEAIDAFRAIISGNNRPTQPLHGREVVLTR